MASSITYTALRGADHHADDARSIAENVASIEAVPAHLWPSEQDRIFALHFARHGYDVYAYTSGGSRGTWCLWLDHERIPLGPAGGA